MPAAAPDRGPMLPLGMLFLAGLSLRVTVLALPAVLNAVTATLGLDGGDVGVLTATPSLCFAVAAIPTALLIRRVGVVACLLAGLALNAVGAALRGTAAGMTGLALTTALLSLGIALMQGAMPSLVKRWLPQRIGLATATYTFGLLVGEVVPVAGAVPIPPLLPGEAWRTQIAAWALPVAATLVVVALWGRRGPRETGAADTWPDWSQAALWQTGLLVGAVNAVYFGLNGFLPIWLARAGHGGDVAGVLFSLNLAQLPAAFLMMAAAERLVGRFWVYATASAALVASALSLALLPDVAPFAVAAVAGFCLALLLALALTVLPLTTADAALPGATAGAFTLGYGIAVAMALATGWLDDVAPGIVGVLPIAIAAAAVAAIGWSIGRSVGRDGA